MLSSLSHPRKRTVSIGPQSQADVYEAIAVRQRRRHDSEAAEQRMQAPPSTRHETIQEDGVAIKNEKAELSLQPGQAAPKNDASALVESDDEDDEELFRKLQVPRVRYDVEVITRLVVYFGKRFRLPSDLCAC